MSRPFATVSVDVDPVDLHLLGYGWRDLKPDALVYERALPRLVELFARHRVRATFFVVARDSQVQAGAIRALATAGHEVASHSLTHPMALARLAPARLSEELVESKRRLEAAAGGEVMGFRSPNFDMTGRTLEALAAAGYRYDASAYPTPLLLPARLLLALKSRDPIGVLALTPWPFTLRRLPHMRRAGAGALHEFPVSVTPGTRFPVYHTVRYGMSDARFAATLDGFARRGEPLSYPLHAVDALGLAEDGVDRRLGRHPGMERPLAAKLDLLERTLGAIAERFETATFRERLDVAAGDPAD